MKKVKIFLGITCLTVAIGSAAFTKANAKLNAPDYFYYIKPGEPPVCIEAVNVICENNPILPDCIRTLSPGQVNKQIYDDAHCTIKLQERP